MFVLGSLSLLVELVLSLEIDLRFIVPGDRPKPPKIAPRLPRDQIFIEKGVEKGIEEDSKPGNSRLLGHD